MMAYRRRDTATSRLTIGRSNVYALHIRVDLELAARSAPAWMLA
jgi:hypothetical protein